MAAIVAICAQAQSIIVPAGIPVPLQLTNELSSSFVKKGDVVKFRVSSDVYYNDELVIPEGAEAQGLVSYAKKRGGCGKGGQLDIEVKTVKLPSGTNIPLQADLLSVKGSKRSCAVVWATCWMFWTLAFLPAIKGDYAVMEEGTAVQAYTK